jgi:hypothetical protein
MAKKNTTNRPRAEEAIMETPAFKKDPWARYKWVLSEPFDDPDEAEESKQNAQDEINDALSDRTGDFIVDEFEWKVNKDGLTYRLRVKLKPVNPPAPGVKNPQPPPPPPTFP